MQTTPQARKIKQLLRKFWRRISEIWETKTLKNFGDTVVPQNFSYPFHFSYDFWSMVYVHTHWHVTYSFTIAFLKIDIIDSKVLAIYDTRI